MEGKPHPKNTHFPGLRRKMREKELKRTVNRVPKKDVRYSPITKISEEKSRGRFHLNRKKENSRPKGESLEETRQGGGAYNQK